MKEYYDRRAPEYDDWWLGRGPFAERERPGWDADLDELAALIRALPPRRTLDVACGTGFLTRHLRSDVVALDQSPTMLDEARKRLPRATLVLGDALALPFPNDAFERLFTTFFYCHLVEDDRVRFLAEAARVARELVVVGSVRADDDPYERWERRTLADGSTWQVFKRVFEPAALASELGGEVLHAGRWFVAVGAPL